jgi:hypothetical protein
MVSVGVARDPGPRRAAARASAVARRRRRLRVGLGGAAAGDDERRESDGENGRRATSGVTGHGRSFVRTCQLASDVLVNVPQEQMNVGLSNETTTPVGARLVFLDSSASQACSDDQTFPDSSPH